MGRMVGLEIERAMAPILLCQGTKGANLSPRVVKNEHSGRTRGDKDCTARSEQIMCAATRSIHLEFLKWPRSKMPRAANSGGGWDVRREGAERASGHFERKSDAMERGRELARDRKSELVEHGKDGRIQDSDSYGRDPNPHDRSHFPQALEEAVQSIRRGSWRRPSIGSVAAAPVLTCHHE